MAINVTFRTGNFASYDNTSYVTGCIYYLLEYADPQDTTSEVIRTHVYLNGTEYGAGDTDLIVFKEAITVTKETGNYTPGTVIPANTTLTDLITDMLSQDINPTVKSSPTVSFSNTSWAGAHEIGTTVSLTYSVSLSDGTYAVEGQPNQSGGVTAKSWHVTSNVGGVDSTSASSGADPVAYRFTDTSTQVQLTAVATGNQGNMPKTFLNKDYPSIRFADNATYSKQSSKGTCYRAKFYGWASDTTNDFAALTGAQIRSLDKGNKAANLPTSINTANMQQMFFAFPQGTYSSVSVINKNTGLPQTVTKYTSTVNVEGADGFTAIAYDVWYVKNDAPELGDSTFTVTVA